MFALWFYGVTFGGFILVGVLGAAAALVSYWIAPARRASWGTILVPSLIVAFVATGTLAILDKLIGSW